MSNPPIIVAFSPSLVKSTCFFLPILESTNNCSLFANPCGIHKSLQPFHRSLWNSQIIVAFSPILVQSINQSRLSAIISAQCQPVLLYLLMVLLLSSTTESEKLDFFTEEIQSETTFHLCITLHSGSLSTPIPKTIKIISKRNLSEKNNTTTVECRVQKG